MDEIKNIILNDNNYVDSENLYFLTNSPNIYDNPNIKEKLLNKVNLLEKKILNYFNIKLNIQLTGNEIKINLNNKNIGNLELNLLSEVEFKNLEEINLSNNKISNITPIKNFKSLKKIDLSSNKIKDIKALKEISKNNKNLENINLSNNSIKDVEILKENIFPCLIEVNLDKNNIIKKDIEEIIKILNTNKEIKRMNKDFSNMNLKVNLQENSHDIFFSSIEKGYNDNYRFKSLIALGNPIIDILVNTDKNTIEKYGLIENNISYVDQTNINYINTIKNDSKLKYIPGGFAQNILRVVSWGLQMEKKNHIINLTMLGAVGEDLYKEKIIKAFESIGVKYLLQTIPIKNTSSCYVLIYKKERYLLTKIMASHYLTDEYIDENKKISLEMMHS